MLVEANQNFGLSCMSFQHEYLPTLVRQEFFFCTLRHGSVGVFLHLHSPGSSNVHLKQVAGGTQGLTM